MAIKKALKKKVFIASSAEARKEGLLDHIISVLDSNGFEAHPWYKEFPSGQIILERLMNIVKEMDFAIFLFNEDMKFTWRNEELIGTAWNVVLEYGLFLQRLNRERVGIIKFGQSHIPTDLSGLVIPRVDPDVKDKVKELKSKTREIVNVWKDIPSLNNDSLGISKSIVDYKNDLELELEVMAKHQKTNVLKGPLKFDESLIISFYLNGLDNVKEKFLTTTYLSSGFWVHKTEEIISANENMLKRLSANKEKDVRRIFLIRREFDEELEILRRKLTDYKNRKGGDDKLYELKWQFKNLRESCESLARKGCEIKFVYDKAYGQSYLSGYITKDDTEIAIYDDSRVDFFDGGRRKKITGIKIFADFHKDFNDMKVNANKYFEHLWEEGKDISILLDQFENTFKYYDKKVDYTLKTLLVFDNDVDGKDAPLKYEELNAVKKHLKGKRLADHVLSYLDIGTCTGRYPFELKKELHKDCLIQGYDADPDCIDYARIKKRIKKNDGMNVDNIMFDCEDFLFCHEKILDQKRKFDLITCMLGTISHFGWDLDHSGAFNDSLQYAIRKMALLLSENGVLIISNWTAHGIQGGMLSIYNETDLRKLKSGTVKRPELEARLNMASLKYDVVTVGQDKELDIFFCRAI